MHWGNGWGDGSGGWGWVLMAVMMVVFWGGLAWIIVSVVRHGGVNRGAVQSGSSVSTNAAVPEDILHERFARGELDAEEYHHRLDVLRSKRPN